MNIRDVEKKLHLYVIKNCLHQTGIATWLRGTNSVQVNLKNIDDNMIAQKQQMFNFHFRNFFAKFVTLLQSEAATGCAV